MARTLTLEEIGELEGERFDKELRRSARQAWRLCKSYKHLALQLGVKRILATKSKERGQGEYLNGYTPNHWEMLWKLSLIIEKLDAVILIDIEQAISLNGIPETITHEIGHHLDHLANGSPKRTPSQSFVSAFERAGFHEYLDAFSDHFSELIAETLGQYLRGHKLNSVLLAEVNKVLAKLTRKHQQIIQAFRNKQRKQNERTN